MVKFYERRKLLAIVVVLVFSILTRTSSLIVASLILLVVNGLPTFSLSREVMRKFANVNVVLAIIFGLYSLGYFTLRIVNFDYSLDRTFVLISAGLALITSLFHLTMAIVFFVKEKKKDDLAKLFSVALLIPIIGTIYVVIDRFVVLLLFNFFLNLNSSGSASGTFTPESTNLFMIVQVILLVYVLVRQKNDNIEEIKTGL